MLRYLMFAYSLENNVKYYIKSSFGEETKLTWEADSIRFTSDEVIKQKTSEIISFITLVKDSKAPTYKIKFKEDKYLCKRNIKESGVISCKKDEGLTDWEIIDNINETFAIRNKDLCLKVKTKDPKLNGYYVHATKCENKDNEFFKFEEVKEESKEKPRSESIENTGELENSRKKETDIVSKYINLPLAKRLQSDKNAICPYYHQNKD